MKQARQSSSPFDLVLLDKGMSSMDGFEMAERVVSSEDGGGSLVMMLPSDVISDDSTRCRELGIASYLVKPVKRSVLLETIIAVMHHQPRARKTPDADAASVTSLHSLRVLVAEDNAAARLIIMKRLEGQGHTATPVTNGVEVLEALEGHSYDIVLMDVEMPRMNGLEATGRIREMEAGTGSHIPIIAMTAYALRGDQEKCLEAGMDGYVSKPIDYDSLYREMERLAPLVGGGEPMSGINADLALEAADGDPELLQEVLEIFFESDYPRLLEDLREGIDAQDAKAVRAAAHGIRGAVSTLGGEAAGAIALKLEDMGRSQDLTGAKTTLADLEHEIAALKQFYSVSQMATHTADKP
jgi:CheY-like chemotaxis protein